jgi:flagellar biosynthesis/type III secretory pathway chaperone
MQTNLTPALVRKLLIDDLAHARQLEQLLSRERKYLEQRQLAELENLLPVKARLLADMEKNDISRKSWLDETGFTADRKGLHACCQYLDQMELEQQVDRSQRSSERPGFATLCEELHEQLDKCRILIDIIGSIVHRSRSDTRKLLGILRGSAEQDNNTYTQRGDTSQRQNSRQLGSA